MTELPVPPAPATAASGKPPAEGGPRAAHEAARDARIRQETALAARVVLLGRLRLLAMGVALLGGLALVQEGSRSGWVATLIAGVAAVLLSVRHLDGQRDLDRARRGRSFHERALARLDGRWRGLGDSGDDLLAALPDAARHPFALDLDLLGQGSLFEMLESPRTPAGRVLLATWLLEPASPAEVLARQEGIGELAARLDLRERLAGLGAEVEIRGLPRLVGWAEDAAAKLQPWLGGAAALSTGTLTAAIGVVGAGWASPWLAALALLGHAAATVVLRGKVDALVAGAEVAAAELGMLVPLLRFARQLEPEAASLRRIRDAVAGGGDGVPAGTAEAAATLLLRRLHVLDAERNLVFAPIAFWSMWRVHLACALDRWRIEHGRRVRAWVDAIAALEAQAGLAGNRFENPDHVFPEVVDASEPSIEALGLGHPLLPGERCVRNDVALGSARRALVVSGSNMSGKSTLLRALGVNVALAQAGGAVRARQMRLTPLAVGASIRLQDSLLDGRSRFQAEIERLRQIMEIAGGAAHGGPPLLFLLDELLAGTNSEDRRIGAEGIVRGLLARGAIGLVTTHDLALAALAGTPGIGIENVHFEERIADGRMSFDFTMRPGPVRRGNAVELMRLIGLEV